jgi:hypothetical protein
MTNHLTALPYDPGIELVVNPTLARPDEPVTASVRLMGDSHSRRLVVGDEREWSLYERGSSEAQAVSLVGTCPFPMPIHLRAGTPGFRFLTAVYGRTKVIRDLSFAEMSSCQSSNGLLLTDAILIIQDGADLASLIEQIMFRLDPYRARRALTALVEEYNKRNSHGRDEERRFGWRDEIDKLLTPYLLESAQCTRASELLKELYKPFLLATTTKHFRGNYSSQDISAFVDDALWKCLKRAATIDPSRGIGRYLFRSLRNYMLTRLKEDKPLEQSIADKLCKTCSADARTSSTQLRTGEQTIDSQGMQQPEIDCTTSAEEQPKAEPVDQLEQRGGTDPATDVELSDDFVENCRQRLRDPKPLIIKAWASGQITPKEYLTLLFKYNDSWTYVQISDYFGLTSKPGTPARNSAGKRAVDAILDKIRQFYGIPKPPSRGS